MNDAFGREIFVGDTVIVARQRKGYSTKGVEMFRGKVLKVLTAIRVECTEIATESNNSQIGEIYTANQSKRIVKV